ncbi:hypothetical protein VHA01S_032_00290 [Vibrio halioticoli NBRC 102217]|uniref:Polysaccharide pyruvyl transferase domain-containing protein n=1 Tax=Vibrio halioticoli NBRC 102217 TaxID=1219072 RepID=V5F4A2_9VIBR|nr:polysaccharide pyruvyl transferase family protein [Vibrio halioticoli]GAD90079.1 hypothetical protein VHA01S_032_00290 [Vibrio halioticoli NBRC 102217]
MNFKKYIPLEAKRYLKSYIDIHNMTGDLTAKNKVFVVLAADYGNLGDVAITFAQSKFLNDNLKNYEVIDVPISRNLTNIRKVKNIINKNDIITIVGGGNLTDNYQSIEDCRLKWVKAFPKNKIVSFPQTIDFSGSTSGNKSFNRSKKIYEAHNNLVMFARERISFDFMKSHLDVEVKLCPDIVLSLDKRDSTFARNGVLTCIRDDDESALTKEYRQSLLRELKVKFKDVTFSDTHIGEATLNVKERKIELEKIWNEFSGSKLVVTDRLHGMIFSVITGTPCIVLENNNHKIKQTYLNWLSDLGYIKLVCPESIKYIISEIDQLINAKISTVKSFNHSTLKNIFRGDV